MIFDLDPSANNFELVIKTEKNLKKYLEILGLKTYVMTTASKGLHVIIPLNRKSTFNTVKSFTQKIATYLVNQYPYIFTTKMRKIKRGKKVFIDTLRNSFSATEVAPYSIRAKESAPITTFLTWSEINSKLKPNKYNIKNIFNRLSKRKDPWENFK